MVMLRGIQVENDCHTFAEQAPRAIKAGIVLREKALEGCPFRHECKSCNCLLLNEIELRKRKLAT